MKYRHEHLFREAKAEREARRRCHRRRAHVWVRKARAKKLVADFYIRPCVLCPAGALHRKGDTQPKHHLANLEDL